MLPPRSRWAVPGTIITALICGLAAAWLFDLTTLEGLLLGSILASPRDGDVRRAARPRSCAGWRARWRPSRGSTTPSRYCWCRLHRLDRGLLLLIEDMLLFRGAAGHRRRRRRRRSAGWRSRPSAAPAGLGGPVPRGVAGVRRAGLRGGRHAEGSGFLAVYLAGLALEVRAIPAKLTVTAFHQGLAWVAQMGSSSPRPARLPQPARRGRAEGTVLALVILLVARPVSTFVATQVGRVPLRERACSSAAGLRGAVPSCSRPSRSSRSCPGASASSTRSSSPSSCRRSCRDPRSSRWRALGATTAEPALPRPLGEAGTIRRLGAEVLEHRSEPGDAICRQPRARPRAAREAVVNVIVRGDEAIPPRGSTILRGATACTSCCARSRRRRSRPSPTAGRWGRSARRRARGPRWAARPSSRCGRCATVPWKARCPARSRWPATAR